MINPRITQHHLKARLVISAAIAGLLLQAPFDCAGAQSAADPWSTGVDVQALPQEPSGRPATGNTTVVPRTPSAAPAATGIQQAQIRLVALLTADGQEIDQGLVWRVYNSASGQAAQVKLVTERREPAPTIKLEAGDYIINAAFGRANLTRKVSVKTSPKPAIEQFVLNAGGLRVKAIAAADQTDAGGTNYTIYSDERDQLNNRTVVMTGAKPGLIIRLNAGIYHIVSNYGDSNASVSSDVTVEAGKLTEVTVTHKAGRATFKLVASSGGDAQPDTQWVITTPSGEIVKESVGALPSHTLLPGSYVVTAKSGGRTFRRDFKVGDGDSMVVEVMMAEAQ